MTNGRIAAPPLSAIQHPLEMFARPSTPDEPAAKLPLGPTPVSTRGPRYELPTKELHDAEGKNWQLVAINDLCFRCDDLSTVSLAIGSIDVCSRRLEYGTSAS